MNATLIDIEPRKHASNKTRTGAYRFGFNGKEKSDEIASTGNHNTAEFWGYDTRLGRFWNLDPIDKPWQSRYHAFSNSPNWKVDLNSDDDTYYNSKDEKNTTIERSRLFEVFFGDRNYIVGYNCKEYKLTQQGFDANILGYAHMVAL